MGNSGPRLTESGASSCVPTANRASLARVSPAEGCVSFHGFESEESVTIKE